MIGGNGNYTLASSTIITSADITPAPLTATVSADDKIYDGTVTAVISGCELEPVTTGVTCDTSAATASFEDGSSGTNKMVIVSGLALSGSRGNYVLMVWTPPP